MGDKMKFSNVVIKEGIRDFWDNRSESDNPYEWDTCDYYHWREGFRRAEKEYKDCKRVFDIE